MILTIMILSRRGSSILSMFLALITAIGLILLSSPSQAIAETAASLHEHPT